MTARTAKIFRSTGLMVALSLSGCTSLDTPKSASEASKVEAPPLLRAPASNNAATRLPDEAPGNLWEDITAGYGLPTVSDAKISRPLRWFGNNQKYLDRVTEQSKPYLHYVASRLREHNIPLELALLPIVESAYDPFVVSPSRAAGVWQFIPETGRNFGLKQNHLYDGRRDIVASTDAAIRYLKKLNVMFDGDWLLAIAAYNAGEGTVRRAIEQNRKAGKPADFWSLSLSQQTQSYVPQLLALAKIVANPAKYDLSLNKIPNTPYFTQINISAPVDLAHAARLANVDPKELRQLNAGYQSWTTNHHGPDRLLIPIADVTEFTLALGQLPVISPIKAKGDYRVVAGDTLSGIAKRFGTSVTAVQAANGLTGTQVLVGQRLQIPGQDAIVSRYAAQVEQEIASRNNSNSGTYYDVRPGDNASSVAKKYGINLNNLLRWNDLGNNTSLKAGQRLLIVNKTSATEQDNKITYQIKNGDTLLKIANRFDVSKKDLLSWNKVKDESYIHPGQELTIYLTANN